MREFRLRVNGEDRQVQANGATPLLFVLRNSLGLTGAKLGCGLEQCGACMVLIDGEACPSCVRSVGECEDKEIVTVEGLARQGMLSRVQRALVDEGAAQCGYCLPGIVIRLTEVFSRPNAPEFSEIRTALDGNICRCGTHPAILRAVRRLASERFTQEQPQS